MNNQLKAIRERLNLSPTEAGMIFFDYRNKNTAQTTWMKWENGSRPMSAPTKMYIKLLAMVPDDILSQYVEQRRIELGSD